MCATVSARYCVSALLQTLARDGSLPCHGSPSLLSLAAVCDPEGAMVGSVGRVQGEC